MINVQCQGVQPIPFKSKPLLPAFELQLDSHITKTKYSNFLKKATANAPNAQETDQIEDRFWADVTNRGKKTVQYSINNPITLFPAEHRYWNLSKLRKYDSLIHGVCTLLYKISISSDFTTVHNFLNNSK